VTPIVTAPWFDQMVSTVINMTTGQQKAFFEATHLVAVSAAQQDIQ